MKFEFARFLVAGGTATAIAYLSYAALIFLGQNAYLSLTLAYVVGYWVNFFLGRHWVFRSGRLVRSLQAEIAATITVTVLGLGLNIVLLAALTNPPLSINPYLGGAISLGVVTVWNYAARKRWVYQ